MGRELDVKYRASGGRYRLTSEASNFAVGTKIQVYVENIKIGEITVEDTGTGHRRRVVLR